MRVDLKPVFDCMRYFYIAEGRPHPRRAAEEWVLYGCVRREADLAPPGVLREAVRILDDLLLLARMFLDPARLTELQTIREETRVLLEKRLSHLVGVLRAGAFCRVSSLELQRVDAAQWYAVETTWFHVLRFDLASRSVVIVPGRQYNKLKSKHMDLKTEFTVNLDEILEAAPTNPVPLPKDKK